MTNKKNIVPPLLQEDLEHVLTHTKPLWEQVRGGRIFVTGATGFFGTWLLETFLYANDQLKLGAELVGLSRNPAAFAAKAPHIVNHPAITMHAGDVRDFIFPNPTFTIRDGDLSQYTRPQNDFLNHSCMKHTTHDFKNDFETKSSQNLIHSNSESRVGKFSHVIHAGTTSSAPVPPLEMLETITRGTRRALDFAVACEAKRFLFVSSGAVYGDARSEQHRFSEEDSTAPDPMNAASAYGEGKRFAELLCRLYHDNHQLETTIARCFAFVGPHLPLDAHFAIGNFLRDALEKKPIVIKSDGQSQRSYLYAADLMIWLWTILFKGEPCRPYNVGSEHALTIKQLAEKVHETLQLNESVQIGTGGKTSCYVSDTTRAQQELSLKEWVSIEESVRKYFDWAAEIT